MPKVRAGAASIPGPKPWRPEDRIFCGEHTWVVLAGTTNSRDSKNEADAAASIAESLVGRSAPPTLDVIQESLLAMARAVAAWSDAPYGPDEDYPWSDTLHAVALVVADDAALIAHVGLTRAYLLSQSAPDEPLVAERLTTDHSALERIRRRSTYDRAYEDDAAAFRARRKPTEPLPEEIWFSGLRRGPVTRIDFTRLTVSRGSRIVLASPGAHRAFETPLGYLRELRTPAEVAQRICIEGRSRAGDQPHHASAIVVDIDPEPLGSAYR